MKTPVRVTITGAAGQIGYQLAFRIASGQMLGPDQPVILQMLEIPPALPALKGVMMELDDCAFSTLAGLVGTDDPNVAFKDSDYALLVGARPRGPGMERKDLLEANAAIFSVQGKAMNEHASRDIRVLVVGNPANTNALIASSNAPDIPAGNFTAMTRLDHNRAMAQLATKTGNHVNDITCMTIWGNHSATQYPDVSNASVSGSKAIDLVDQNWLAEQFIPIVQQRGAAIIKARGIATLQDSATTEQPSPAAAQPQHDSTSVVTIKTAVKPATSATETDNWSPTTNPEWPEPSGSKEPVQTVNTATPAADEIVVTETRQVQTTPQTARPAAPQPGYYAPGYGYGYGNYQRQPLRQQPYYQPAYARPSYSQ